MRSMVTCSFCNNLIVGGEYYSVDMWGNTYHTYHHQQNNSICSCCQSLIMPGEQNYKLSQGNAICTMCKSDAILNDIQFNKCIAAVYTFYALGNIKLPNEKIKMHLCDINDLPHNVRGQVIYDSLGYTVQMMRGLSKAVFCGVLVHEFMHIVLIEGSYNFSHVESEGLCELASFFAYKQMDNLVSNEWINRMTKSPDPIYGEGFRIMMARVKPYGSLQKFLDSQKNI